MDSLIDSYSKTKSLHHAYIIEGEREIIRANLLEFLEKKLKENIVANPDFYHEIFESFSIDNARAIREKQSAKALGENRKIFIIETLSMTVEAQNSLLKVFEEPTADTHFFILTPSAQVFLPTLLSRVVVVPADSMYGTSNSNVEKNIEKEEQKIKEAKKFIKMSSKDRLDYVSTIVEEKNKALAISLLENLLFFFHQESEKKKEQTAFAQKELLQARMFVSDRSPSLKLILEHISLILPSI